MRLPISLKLAKYHIHSKHIMLFVFSPAFWERLVGGVGAAPPQ